MKVAILGSTGSIGKNVIEVCKNQGYTVTALSCNSNIDLLIEQYRELKPKMLAVKDKKAYDTLKKRLALEPVTIVNKGGGIQICRHAKYDVIVNSIVGFAGLLPAVEACHSGKRLALANKESLVIFGETIMQLAKEKGTEIVPIDSEHSAIFQALQGNRDNEIEKVILTASGGPFRDLSKEEIAKKTCEEAIKHPNWSMGKKISVDSATMMNKGLELIEAMHLFNISEDKIDVLVHPQSIVHSGVKYKDKSIILQASSPDMKLPIQYALNYPNRYENCTEDIDLTEIKKLEFFEPDEEKFPCLRIAREVAKKGGFFPCIMNSANEYAVDLYLKGEIGFYDISNIIEKALTMNFEGNHKKIADIIKCNVAVKKFLDGGK